MIRREEIPFFYLAGQEKSMKKRGRNAGGMQDCTACKRSVLIEIWPGWRTRFVCRLLPPRYAVGTKIIGAVIWKYWGAAPFLLPSISQLGCGGVLWKISFDNSLNYLQNFNNMLIKRTRAGLPSFELYRDYYRTSLMKVSSKTCILQWRIIAFSHIR